MQEFGSIYILVDGLTAAGAEKQALVLARELSYFRSVTFLYLKVPNAFEKERIQVIMGRNQHNVIFQPLRIGDFWHLLRLSEFVLITFAVKANFIGRLLKLFNPQIHLVTSIRNERFSNVWVNRLYRLTAKVHESTIYNSQNALIKGVEQGFSTAGQSTKIHNYIDWCEAPIRTEMKPIRCIAYLGRLASQKRIPFLLKALRKLHDSGHDLKLSIHGHGPLKHSLMDLTDRLGLGKHVRFGGAYKEIDEVLSDVDLVVLPSEWEGMPNVVLECGMYGIPIIGSDAGGMKDIERVLSNGQFVPLNSADDLYQLLVQWINKSPQELNKVIVTMRNYISLQHKSSSITLDWSRVIDNA
jgi:glycosyltransferase involved in cell wall biosynthesis